MTDAELRALVRDSVARHLATPDGLAGYLGQPGGAPQRAASTLAAPDPTAPWLQPQHPSHHLYVALVNVDESCVIEPSVPCDHCGYCKSHGH